MAEIKYVSPENLEVVETELKNWIITKISTAVNQLINGAPEALDTMKEISDYISTHTDEYNALVALVSDKASQTDLTALQTTVSNLQTQIMGSSHSHSNKAILDATTASFTSDLLTKLNGLVNYDDSEISAKVESLEGQVHSHTNKTVLDNTTASYTIAEQNKLNSIESGANKTVIDLALSNTSTNPVQNKAVAARITSLDSAVATVQEDIDNLAASITSMTSEEITEMFNRVFGDSGV